METSSTAEMSCKEQNTVAQLMLSRHSTRSFLPTPVPRSLLEDVLAMAQRAPSNSNLQPWRVKIVTNTALQRLCDVLVDTVRSGGVSSVEPIPDVYKHYRSELGHQLYGPEGYNIARTDRDGSLRAQLRNFKFFDAPVAIILCMDRRLAQIDVLSAGMYLQTLCLLLLEHGLGVCVEASVAGYPQVIKRELGLAEDMSILAGVAVGFEDNSHPVNHLNVVRDAWKDSVEFMDA